LATVYALPKTNPARPTVEKTAKTGTMIVRKFLEWVRNPVEEVTAQDVGAYTSEMQVKG